MNLGKVTKKTNAKKDLILSFDKKVFKNDMPDGFKESYDYMQKFAEDVQKEAVDLAVGEFKSDKSLQEVKVVAPFGTSAFDKLTVNVSRERLVRDMKNNTESMQPRVSVKMTSNIDGSKKALSEQKTRLKELMAKI